MTMPRWLDIMLSTVCAVVAAGAAIYTLGSRESDAPVWVYAVVFLLLSAMAVQLGRFAWMKSKESTEGQEMSNGD